MESATVTSKGQVTIPVEVRRSLDVKTGDRLVFEVVGEVVQVRVLRRRKLTEFLGELPATRPFPGKSEVRRQVARALAQKRTVGR